MSTVKLSLDLSLNLEDIDFNMNFGENIKAAIDKQTKKAKPKQEAEETNVKSEEKLPALAASSSNDKTKPKKWLEK